jgi:hypothetical protein
MLIVLWILLTLPLSVAPSERSFSRLKLIKMYIHSAVVQQRPVGFAAEFVEQDTAQNLTTNNCKTTTKKKKI